MPGIVTPCGRAWPTVFALAMKVRRLHREPLTDLLEGYAVTVDAQRRAEAKVVRLVRLFAVEEAPQRAKHLGWFGVIHRHITTKLSSRGGSVSYQSRKAYMPPRSAAASGSAAGHPTGHSSTSS